MSAANSGIKWGRKRRELCIPCQRAAGSRVATFSDTIPLLTFRGPPPTILILYS